MSDSEDELFDVLRAVHDEESFRQFLLALRDDRKRSIAAERETPSDPFGPEAGGWENITLEQFFDSAATWAKASVNGTGGYPRTENPWRRCADILYMGKIYE